MRVVVLARFIRGGDDMKQLVLICLLLAACSSGPWQSIRTGAMYPNLNRDSQCVLDTQTKTYEIGHVVLVNIDGIETARRIAAVAGDRVDMTDGVITRNGNKVQQSTIRKRIMCHIGVNARCSCRISKETLGTRTYQVQQLVPPDLDGDARCEPQYPDVTDLLIPTGHVFVTADNRDGALDSRVIGPISLEKVLGRIARCRY